MYKQPPTAGYWVTKRSICDSIQRRNKSPPYELDIVETAFQIIISKKFRWIICGEFGNTKRLSDGYVCFFFFIIHITQYPSIILH